MELTPQLKQKKMKISRKLVEDPVENLSKHSISSLWYLLNQDYNLDHYEKWAQEKTLLKFSIIYILFRMLNYDYLTVIKLDHYVDYKLRFGSKK